VPSHVLRAAVNDLLRAEQSGKECDVEHSSDGMSSSVNDSDMHQRNNSVHDRDMHQRNNSVHDRDMQQRNKTERSEAVRGVEDTATTKRDESESVRVSNVHGKTNSTRENRNIQRRDECAQREELLLSVLRSGDACIQEALHGWDETMLAAAQAAKMRRLCWTLRSRTGDYGELLRECLEREHGMRASVFQLVSSLFIDARHAERRDALLDALLVHIRALAEVDTVQAATVIVQEAPERVTEAARLLRGEPELQHAWLRSAATCVQQRGTVDMATALDGEAQDMLVSLMCVYDSKAVLPFLLSHDGYRLDVCLKACSAAPACTAAAAYLMERMGAAEAGLRIMLKDLAQRVNDAVRMVRACDGGDEGAVDMALLDEGV
jgi:hypothetical protein